MGGHVFLMVYIAEEWFLLETCLIRQQVLLEGMSYRNACLIGGGHVLQVDISHMITYLIRGCILQEDMSCMSTGLTEGYVM